MDDKRFPTKSANLRFMHKPTKCVYQYWMYCDKNFCLKILCGYRNNSQTLLGSILGDTW